MTALAGLAACSSSSSSASASSTSASATQGGGAGGATAGGAAALQDDIISVVKKAGPSVVRIDTAGGLGSGVVLDSQGDIVTNAHVVGDATSMDVTTVDGRQYAATLVSSFVPGDLAVIKVANASLTPATFADSSKLVVGDLAVAMGSPLGFTASVTQGLVSALDRTVNAGGGVTLPGLIQTSAPINPGNSGGALLDINGAVIGINTLVALGPSGGQAPGIGFAIPSNTAKDIATQIVTSGHVTNSRRAALGTELTTATGLAGRPVGAYVVSVEPGGPAASAGIVAGDTITAINGTSTPTVDDVATVLAGLSPGKMVPVAVTHADGAQSTVNVTLGTLPGGS
ncbi:MAG TPA: trypsin-like peptidase domain-containing protein [Candidatus Dormibacteraeota bacterium]